MFFKEIEAAYRAGKIAITLPATTKEKNYFLTIYDAKDIYIEAKDIYIEAKGILWFKAWFLSPIERMTLAKLMHEDALRASFDVRKITFDQMYADKQRILESQFSVSDLEKLCVNIWDDYSDPGSTYAYLGNGNVPELFAHQFLVWLLPHLEKSLNDDSIVLDIFYYEILSEYPDLLGSRFERGIHNRWQINFCHLPHKTRERIVDELNAFKLTFKGIPVRVISES